MLRRRVRQHHPRRQTAYRIEGTFEAAHGGDPFRAVETPQQLLLDAVTSCPVLRHRTAAELDRDRADLELGFARASHLLAAARNHVRMEIAVGDVPPDRVVESAPVE